MCTGGRDKRGGPILTFPARSNHDRIKQEDLRRLVTYLSTVPRYTHTHEHTHIQEAVRTAPIGWVTFSEWDWQREAQGEVHVECFEAVRSVESNAPFFSITRQTESGVWFASAWKLQCLQQGAAGQSHLTSGPFIPAAPHYMLRMVRGICSSGENWSMIRNTPVPSDNVPLKNLGHFGVNSKPVSSDLMWSSLKADPNDDDDDVDDHYIQSAEMAGCS